jgi:hypothetical protein
MLLPSGQTGNYSVKPLREGAHCAARFTAPLTRSPVSPYLRGPGAATGSIARAESPRRSIVSANRGTALVGAFYFEKPTSEQERGETPFRPEMGRHSGLAKPRTITIQKKVIPLKRFSNCSGPLKNINVDRGMSLG